MGKNKITFEFQTGRDKKNLLILFVMNIPVIIFYCLLYHIPGIRPYGNIAYFIILLIIGYAFGKGFTGQNLQAGAEGKGKTRWIFSGVFLMIFIFGLMRLSFFIIARVPVFKNLIDIDLWQYFVRPWHNINIYFSVISIIMIVFSVEMFYRLYIQNTFDLFFPKGVSVLLASLISGMRALTLGPVSGIVDFGLAWIWGTVYYRSGFFGAVIVHMVWDILFVYFPPS